MTGSPLRKGDAAAVAAAVTLASTARQRRDPAAALAHLEAVLDQGAPILPDEEGAARFLAAELMLELDRQSEAEAMLRRLVEAAPEHWRGQRLLARIRQDRGALPEALAAFERAAAAAPKEAVLELAIEKGRLLYRMQDFTGALASFAEALRIEPRHPVAHVAAGHCCRRLGEPRDAVEHFRAAIATAPEYADAHDGLGFALKALGRRDEAIAAFRTAHLLFEPYLAFAADRRRGLDGVLARTGERGRLAVKTLRGLGKWYLRGEHDDDAFTAFRVLHQASQGRSTDTLNAGLRVLRRREERQTPRFHGPTILPDSGLDPARIAEEIAETGFHVFSGTIDPALAGRLADYAGRTPSRPYPRPAYAPEALPFEPARTLAPTYTFEPGPLLQDALFQTVYADPLCLEIARCYFGMLPKLDTVVLWHSARFDDLPSSHAAQLFHIDMGAPRWLKLFIYLSDVTAETGAHSIVRGSHRRERRARHLHRRGLVRVCDEDIFDTFGPERVVDIIGPRGTVFIADTRAYHKGRHPTAGDRLALQVYYVNDLYGSGAHPRSPIRPRAEAMRRAAAIAPGIFERYGLDLGAV